MYNDKNNNKMSSKPEKQPSRLAKKPDVTELQYLMNSQACEHVVLEILREMKRHQTKQPFWDKMSLDQKQEEIKNLTVELITWEEEDKGETAFDAIQLVVRCIRLIREL